MRRTYREMPAVVPLRCTWAASESAFQATSSRAAIFKPTLYPIVRRVARDSLLTRGRKSVYSVN